MPDERDFPDERWAARLGRVGPGLWQLETLQKYGYYRPSNDMTAVGVQAGYGYLLSRDHGPFFAGWNYVLGTEPSAGARFVEAAALLGEARALPLPTGHHLRTGPYAASIYMERPEPVPLPALQWPFERR